MSEVLRYLVVAAVLGSGLVAGIFFAFSTFVMQALGRLPRERGIAAMQEINIKVLNPLFFLAFLGTAVICVTVALPAFRTVGGTIGLFMLCGSALYLLGCILVTVAFNVPLNNRLASVESDSEGALAMWANYLTRWTFWNHVRTAASLAAAALFAMSL